MQIIATAAGELAAAAHTAAADLAGKSMSENTTRTYRAALNRLSAYLASTGESLSDAAVAGYIATLEAAGKAPATGRMVIAAVAFAARKSGAPNPLGEKTRECMQGFARQAAGRGRGQARPLDWRTADSVVIEASKHGIAGARDAAIIAVMSDGLLRISEAAALNAGDFQPQPDGSATLRIRKSKSDQTGKGASIYIGAPTAARLRRYMTDAGIESGALFRRIRRGGHVTSHRLSPAAVADIVRKRVADANPDITGISGHSARVGSACELAAAGASLADMQTAGRWKSVDMPGRYAAAQLAGRGAVARYRYKAA